MYDIYDNDFDKAFDEAVDAIEKKEHRLIWADVLKHTIAHRCVLSALDAPQPLAYRSTDIFDLIDEQPTADPRVHGKWLDKKVTVEVQELLGCRYDDRVFECSHCGNLEMTRSNYCPRCGAYMLEVDNGKTY